MDEEFENDMDEKLLVKLLTNVFKKLPPNSYLCVDVLFDFVFKDGFLPELNTIKEDMEDHRGFCSFKFKLTPYYRDYLIENLKLNTSLVNYLCHYMIIDGTNVLLDAYDRTLITIRKDFNISQNFIQECDNYEIYISIKEEIISTFN